MGRPQALRFALLLAALSARALLEFPCTISDDTGLVLSVSWTQVRVPIVVGAHFDTREQLYDAAQKIVRPICEQHRAQHNLTVPACTSEIVAAFLAAADRVCARDKEEESPTETSC